MQHGVEVLSLKRPRRRPCADWRALQFNRSYQSPSLFVIHVSGGAGLVPSMAQTQIAELTHTVLLDKIYLVRSREIASSSAAEMIAM